jgi:hypothetical protein
LLCCQEALDVGLQIGAKLLQIANFPVSLSEVFSENGKDFLFWLNAAWIGKGEINDVADLVQAQSELLELVDFPQASKRFLALVVVTVPLTLCGREQPDTLIVANGTLGHSGLLCQITDPHTLLHHFSPKHDVNVTFVV